MAKMLLRNVCTLKRGQYFFDPEVQSQNIYQIVNRLSRIFATDGMPRFVQPQKTIRAKG